MSIHTWIFSFAEPFSLDQTLSLTEGVQDLLSSWKAHGTPVPGSFSLIHHQFLVVQAEPGTTSGCSIDSMNRGVRALLEKIHLQPLDSHWVLFRNAAGSIEKVDFREISERVKEGKMSGKTMVFDATAAAAGNLQQWETELENTWMKRFLPVQAV